MRDIRRSLVGLTLAAIAMMVAGCPAPTTTTPAGGGASGGGSMGHAHEHPSQGPHHGHLIELGNNEEYHAELVDDHGTHTVTIYLLDGAATGAVTSADPELAINLVVDGRPAQFALPAVPQDGDPAGGTSRYQIVDKALCDALHADKTTGRMNVTIAGKVFVGQIEHHAHGEHAHHDHDDRHEEGHDHDDGHDHEDGG
jgi:hypothetical protein